MITLAIIALTTVSLMNPPMQINWAAAGVVIGSEELSVEERCGVENAEVFVVLAQQTATNGMSRDEREDYDALVERFASEYEGGGQRGQALLAMELLTLSKGRTRQVSRAWIILDDKPIVLTRIYDLTEGGEIFKIEDEISGAYLSYSLVPKDDGDFAATKELINTMLATDDPKEKRAAIDEIARLKSGNEARFEVNGEVATLSTEDPSYRVQALTLFTDLWPNLEPADGRERIEKAVPIIWAMIKDESSFKAVAKSRVWPHEIYPDSLGHDACVLATGVEFINGRSSGDSRLHYESPPDNLVEEFFGDEGLPMPDPDLSWKELVKLYR